MLIIFMTLDDPQDRELFTRLYTEYAALLIGCAYRILEDWGDAEDVVHDVFAALMDSPERIRRIPEEKQKAFLIVCTRNRARNILKKKKPVLELEYAENEEAPGYFDTEGSDLAALLEAEIAKLPPDRQEILILHYYWGLKFEEIGKILNKNPAAVQKMSIRLTKVLKERLEGGAL